MPVRVSRAPSTSSDSPDAAVGRHLDDDARAPHPELRQLAPDRVGELLGRVAPLAGERARGRRASARAQRLVRLELRRRRSDALASGSSSGASAARCAQEICGRRAVLA